MDHQSFNRVLPLLFDAPFIQRCWLCYYFHCVDILLINTWMDGWNENRQTMKTRRTHLQMLMTQNYSINQSIIQSIRKTYISTPIRNYQDKFRWHDSDSVLS